MFCVFASFVINDPLHILKVFGLGLAVAVADRRHAWCAWSWCRPSMELLGPRQLVDAQVPPPHHPHHRRGGHAVTDAHSDASLIPAVVAPLGVRANLPASLDPVRNESEPVATLVSINPGRDVQRVGTAAFLGQDVRKIHDPVWAVVGNLGDSQCYLGVQAKVAAVQAAVSRRIGSGGPPRRLIAPAFTLGVSDGQLNGTPEMRFSLTGRELVNDATAMHLAANGVAGLIAVVACDKRPVGTVAALLEHNVPSVILSDGSIRPGVDPETGERIDIITAFQVASDPDDEVRARAALHACPGQGSCGGMFTYNTMQTFIGVLGLSRAAHAGLSGVG